MATLLSSTQYIQPARRSIGNAAQSLQEALTAINTLEENFDVAYLHEEISRLRSENTALKMDIVGYEDSIKGIEDERDRFEKEAKENEEALERIQNVFESIEAEVDYYRHN